MHINGKYVYSNCSENLSGKPILMTVVKYDNRTVEITINYASRNNLRAKKALILLIFLFNLICCGIGVLGINYFIAVVVLLLYVAYSIAFSVKQERIIVVESLGYQIEEQYIVGHVTRFIAWEHIKSVIINELVSKQRVVFVLTLLTKDTAKGTSAIIPLFTNTMPRLRCLERIFQCIESCHA